MVLHFAVMGNPIAHSLSPFIHRLFAREASIDLLYEKIHVELNCFEQRVIDFFEQGGAGLNITLPFKERACLMSDAQSPRCKIAKAANTLWMKQNQIYADNTDGVGLLRDLARHFELKGKSILLLGAGGAARGVIAPLLEQQPIKLTIVNRTIEKAALLQKDFPSVECVSFERLKAHLLQHTYAIVINATSAHINSQHLDLPEALLIHKPFCYDLSYNLHQDTPFVHQAKQYDCCAVDGLGMLVEQAAEAFYLWHGVMPDTTLVIGRLHSGEKSFD